MMRVLRPASHDDLEDIYTLALQRGVGLTTLVADKAILSQRIALSIDAFSKPVKAPADENYFLVLEDIQNKRVIGTSAIEAAVGFHSPFYSYRLAKVTRVCQQLNIHTEYNSLHLVNDFHGKTEIATLFLHPELRQQGDGHLLSRGRFLLMAQFPNRFTDTIFAEIRGVIDDKGCSPFWQSLGKHFFLMEFSDADRLTAMTDKQFIADLMPRNSIYTILLSAEAQKAIGQAAEASMPALNLLQREGFSYEGYVDIFDAGPVVKAPFSQVKTIANSHVLRVTHIMAKIEGPLYLISNTHLDFRACIGHVMVTDDEVWITQQVADLLQVQVNESIRCVVFSDEHM